MSWELSRQRSCRKLFSSRWKRERIKKKSGTQEEACSDIFDYIEMIYDSKRRHGSGDQMSPAEYENQYYQGFGSVLIFRGDASFRRALLKKR